MQFTFAVEVNVERLQGKFASREEVQELLQDLLLQAVDGELLDTAEDGEYEVTAADVWHDDERWNLTQKAAKAEAKRRRREAAATTTPQAVSA